jgi:hypothetical protein
MTRIDVGASIEQQLADVGAAGDDGDMERRGREEAALNVDVDRLEALFDLFQIASLDDVVPAVDDVHGAVVAVGVLLLRTASGKRFLGMHMMKIDVCFRCFLFWTIVFSGIGSPMLNIRISFISTRFLCRSSSSTKLRERSPRVRHSRESRPFFCVSHPHDLLQ